MDKMEREAWAAKSGEMSFQVPLSRITVRVTPVIWVPRDLKRMWSVFRKKSAWANYAALLCMVPL